MSNKRGKTKGAPVKGEVTGGAPPEKPVTEAKVTGTAPVSETGGGRSAESANRPNMAIAEQTPVRVPYESSQFGDTWPTKRGTGILPDSVQWISETILYDVRGYINNGTSALLPSYADATELFAAAFRDLWRIVIAQTGKKPFDYSGTIVDIDATNLIWYMNMYVTAVGQMVAMADLHVAGNSNQATSAYSVWLPKYMPEVQKLWALLGSVWAPPLLKAEGIRIGKGFWDPELRKYYGRFPFWRYGEHVPTGLTAANQKITTWSTESNVIAILTNLRHAIQSLQAASNDSTWNGKIMKLNNLFEVMSSIRGFSEIFTQGLPPLEKIAGPAVDPLYMEEILYCRGWYINDTKGVGTDEFQAFPVVYQSDFGNKVPIIVPGGINDQNRARVFSLFGPLKASQLANSVAGVRYTTSSTYALYGTEFNNYFTGTSHIYSRGEFDIYTKEDGLVALDAYQTDFGDGASIRAWFNGEHPLRASPYSQIVFMSQLAGSYEFRWIDNIKHPVVWVDPDQLCKNYARLWAIALRLPYLKQ